MIKKNDLKKLKDLKEKLANEKANQIIGRRKNEIIIIKRINANVIRKRRIITNI